MNDYIRRETAIKICKTPGCNVHDILFALKTIPGKVEVTDDEEQTHGKWIYQFHEDEVGVTCSECEGYAESFARWIYDEGYRIDYNYCPNCGARMDGEA